MESPSMAVKFIHKAAEAASEYTGSHAGIGVDSDDNRLYFNPNGTRRAVAVQDVSVVTASATATSADAGKTYVANSTTSVVISLPTAASCPGAVFGLVVRQLTSSGGHAFSPTATNAIEGNGLTSADDKDVLCTAATDREGDFIAVQSDGVLTWTIIAITGTWAKEP